jgi:hypothetical protein
MSRRAVLLSLFSLAAMFFGPRPAGAYSTNVHQVITSVAASQSTGLEGFSEDNSLSDESIMGPADVDRIWKETWGTWLLCKPKPEPERALNAGFLRGASAPHVGADYPIQLGSILEDARVRFFNHFYKPTVGNQGLPLNRIGLGEYYTDCNSFGPEGEIILDARAWALGNPQNTGNVHDFQSAVLRLHQGLVARDPIERRTAVAEGLTWLGCVSHLLQDMTSPAHVRDDLHADFGSANQCFGPSAYERYTEHLSEPTLRQIMGGGSGVAAGTSYAQASLTPPSVSFDQVARRTARNYFSDDTILDNACTTLGAPVRVFTDAEWAALGGEPQFALVNALEVMHVTSPDVVGPLAAFPKMIGGQPIRTILDARQHVRKGTLHDPDNVDEILSTYARNLLPSARDATVGLLDYFFRARLRISEVVVLPEDASDAAEVELTVVNDSPSGDPQSAALCSLIDFDERHVTVLLQKKDGTAEPLEIVPGSMTRGVLRAPDGSGDCPQATLSVRIPKDMAKKQDSKLRLVYLGQIGDTRPGLFASEVQGIASVMTQFNPGLAVTNAIGHMLVSGALAIDPDELSTALGGMAGAFGSPEMAGEFSSALASFAEAITVVCPGTKGTVSGAEQVECCPGSESGEAHDPSNGGTAGQGGYSDGSSGGYSDGGSGGYSGGGDGGYTDGSGSVYTSGGGESSSPGGGGYSGGSNYGSNTGAGGAAAGGATMVEQPCFDVPIEDTVSLRYATKESEWSYECRIGGPEGTGGCRRVKVGSGLVETHSVNLWPGQTAVLRFMVDGHSQVQGLGTYSLNAIEMLSGIARLTDKRIEFKDVNLDTSIPSEDMKIEISYQEVKSGLMELFREQFAHADPEVSGPEVELARCVGRYAPELVDRMFTAIPLVYIVTAKCDFKGTGNAGSFNLRTTVEIQGASQSGVCAQSPLPAGLRACFENAVARMGSLGLSGLSEFSGLSGMSGLSGQDEDGDNAVTGSRHDEAESALGVIRNMLNQQGATGEGSLNDLIGKGANMQLPQALHNLIPTSTSPARAPSGAPAGSPATDPDNPYGGVENPYGTSPNH